MRHTLVAISVVLVLGCAKDGTDEPGVVFTGTNRDSPVVFEIHLGDDQPGEGKIEQTIPLTGGKCYVYMTPDLTNHDILRARLYKDNQVWKISALLSPDSGDTMRDITGKNKGKRLVTMVRGKVVIAPKILMPIGEKLVVELPLFSEEEATTIAKSMVGQ